MLQRLYNIVVSVVVNGPDMGSDDNVEDYILRLKSEWKSMAKHSIKCSCFFLKTYASRGNVGRVYHATSENWWQNR